MLQKPGRIHGPAALLAAVASRRHLTERPAFHLESAEAPDEAARRQGTTHSKYAVIDGTRALVGSYNLDPRREPLNSETAVIFLRPELAERLRHSLLTNDLRYSREITIEQAQQFEQPAKVIERFRKLIGDLFADHL